MKQHNLHHTVEINSLPLFKVERWEGVGFVFNKEELDINKDVLDINKDGLPYFDGYLTRDDIVVLIMNPCRERAFALSDGKVVQLLCKHGIVYTYDFNIRPSMNALT